ncbi:MAG TPA: hypothetical protein VK066_20135 [Chloroflexota bacterium]|nr:hypothetical protein [Chloroflexota bacterium]
MPRLRLAAACVAVGAQAGALAWAANLPTPLDLVQLYALSNAALVAVALAPRECVHPGRCLQCAFERASRNLHAFGHRLRRRGR